MFFRCKTKDGHMFHTTQIHTSVIIALQSQVHTSWFNITEWITSWSCPRCELCCLCLCKLDSPCCSNWFEARVCSLTSLESLRRMYGGRLLLLLRLPLVSDVCKLRSQDSGKPPGNKTWITSCANAILLKHLFSPSFVLWTNRLNEANEHDTCEWGRSARLRTIRTNEANEEYSHEWSEWRVFARMKRMKSIRSNSSNHFDSAVPLPTEWSSRLFWLTWMVSVESGWFSFDWINLFFLPNRPVDLQPERLEFSVAV